MLAQIDFRYIRARPIKLLSRLLSYALFEGRPLTTRGRWINFFVFSCFSVIKRLPFTRSVEAPVFILGTGRSGTTILGIVMSMHRDVGFLNEPKALWNSVYSNEDLIGSYTLKEARYRLSREDASAGVVASAHKLFGAYLCTIFAQRVVDKYPELIFRVPFVREIFGDSRFLFLVRNGWDTCHSIDSWSRRLGAKTDGGTHDWWGKDRRKWNFLIEQLIPEHPDLEIYAQEMKGWTRQADMAAVEWIVTMREGLRLIAEMPDVVMRVNYEGLCNAPTKSLTDISEFIGLSIDEVFLDYGEATLVPARGVKPFDLDQSIRAPFLETMKALGYD